MLWDTGSEQLIQTCGLGKSPEKMLFKLCKSESQNAKCPGLRLTASQNTTVRQTRKHVHRSVYLGTWHPNQAFLPPATYLAPKANSAAASFPRARPP